MNNIRDMVHGLAKEKGWHDFEETDLQYLSRAIVNIHAELSELWEAARKGELNSPCDKDAFVFDPDVRQLTCLEEEVADVLIRALDLAGRFNIDVDEVVRAKHSYNKTRPHRHGKLA